MARATNGSFDDEFIPSSSDEMLMKNIELFDKLSIRLHNRILFIKDVTGSEEICCWSFYGNTQKLAEVCCTSIVYATERKQNKVRSARPGISLTSLSLALPRWNSSRRGSTKRR